MKSGIFITGTSTGVGKTFCSALLTMAMQAYSNPVRYFKPVQTGTDTDCEAVQALGVAVTDIIQPRYAFPAPLSPYQAAQLENQQIDMDKIVQYWQQLPDGCYIMEGAGGLLVPLAKKILIRDLIKSLQLPLVIVASTALGTINHSLLTLEAAQAAGIAIKGLILNGPELPGLKATLMEFTQAPIIAEIPWLETNRQTDRKAMARKIFSNACLKKLFCYD